MEWAVFFTLVAVYGTCYAMAIYEALRTKTPQERMQQDMQEVLHQMAYRGPPRDYVFIDLRGRSRSKEKVNWAKEGF